MSRPAAAHPHDRDDRRHQQRADEERVDQQTERDDEGKLPERLDRDERQRSEGDGKHDARSGDRRRGRRGARHDRLAQGARTRVGPDPTDEEDVVVRAEGDEQHAGGDGHEVGQLGLPQQALEDVHGDAERGQRRGQGERHQIQRCHERAQQDYQYEHDRHQDGGHDARDVLRRPVDRLLHERRVPGEARGRRRQGGSPQQLGKALSKLSELAHRLRAQRIVREKDDEACPRPVRAQDGAERTLRRIAGRPDDRRHARLGLQQTLQSRQLGAAAPDFIALDDDDRRGDHPGRQAGGGLVVGGARRTVRRQPAQQRVSQIEPEHAGGHGRQHHDAPDGHPNRAAHDGAQRAGRPRPAGRAVAGPARPEDPRPPDGAQRRDERHRGGERDHHRCGHAGTEGAEEAQLGEHQRAGSRRHGHPARREDRQQLTQGASRRGLPVPTHLR